MGLCLLRINVYCFQSGRDVSLAPLLLCTLANITAAQSTPPLEVFTVCRVVTHSARADKQTGPLCCQPQSTLLSRVTSPDGSEQSAIGRMYLDYIHSLS